MRACMTDAQREEQAWTIDTAILARTYNIIAAFIYARASESPPLIVPPSLRDVSEVENFALPEDEYERIMAMFEDHGEVI